MQLTSDKIFWDDISSLYTISPYIQTLKPVGVFSDQNIR